MTRIAAVAALVLGFLLAAPAAAHFQGLAQRDVLPSHLVPRSGQDALVMPAQQLLARDPLPRRRRQHRQHRQHRTRKSKAAKKQCQRSKKAATKQTSTRRKCKSKPKSASKAKTSSSRTGDLVKPKAPSFSSGNSQTLTKPKNPSSGKSANSAAAADTSSSSSNNGGGSLRSQIARVGFTSKGDGTFFSTGLGACGWTTSDSDKIVALSQNIYDLFSVNGNPNNNALCGRHIQATAPNGKSVTVRVVDRCVGCASGDLDFSPSAFKQLADFSVGRLANVQWKFVD